MIDVDATEPGRSPLTRVIAGDAIDVLRIVTAPPRGICVPLRGHDKPTGRESRCLLQTPVTMLNDWQACGPLAGVPSNCRHRSRRPPTFPRGHGTHTLDGVVRSAHPATLGGQQQLGYPPQRGGGKGPDQAGLLLAGGLTGRAVRLDPEEFQGVDRHPRRQPLHPLGVQSECPFTSGNVNRMVIVRA